MGDRGYVKPEPLKNKFVFDGWYYVAKKEDVKSAYRFYELYRTNASKLCKERPEDWVVWRHHLKDNRYASFDEWLLEYAFQDVIDE